ncbi:MAG TPA: hypothetical protein VEA58_11795, partial [Anaerovoracaceae bacterium]|nr:hypothetical protein [Anaerovoracaceae bacterium]
MKGTLLRVFSAMIIVVLVVTVILNDSYGQKLPAEDGKGKKERLQNNNVAIETDKQNMIQEEQQKILLRQLAEEQEQKETYSFTAIDDENGIFTNKVDGYTIKVPRDMDIDMHFSNIRAVLENENLKIEVYRQAIENSAGCNIESYVNYSNQFIYNNIDHYKELEGKTRIDGREVSYLQWSRRSLEKIENDRCYYASVDVPLSEQEVITILFKSNRKFENKSYLEVARSLNLNEKSAEPYVQKIHKTENKNWDAKTASVYEQFFGENTRLHWGIFETDAPVNFTELKKIEEKVDFTFPI